MIIHYYTSKCERFKDVDSKQHPIMVRDPKEMHDRTTMLSVTLKLSLQAQLLAVKYLHEHDLASGHEEVSLPNVPAQKYPNAAREWAWQFFVPSSQLSPDPYDGRIKPIISTKVYCKKPFARQPSKQEFTKMSVRTPSALFCNPPARGRIRYPRGPRITRPHGCQN